LQVHPPPQRQTLLQAQLAPQLQRPAATAAHPQDAFSQRHSVLIWFSIVFSSFAARFLAR